ncbi:TPA: DUF2622 domain-containing protein [Klebsiella pneumoniae]|nr:DUF2622 domain-containing protein [Klebsiella pneumoniae]HBR4847968.1 DUF2622 domain-containing protein [Klebsiella pneumoniae]HBR4886924.1 DUF2622 domain-containing protein [Klebsiella pneumoniae]HBR5248550.1 DUF2622 domain-containing protein [Klebsiella pneumoniae]HBR5299914.1 DUF2622 domain-containing protein [Klebsiella pneumoniae]
MADFTVRVELHGADAEDYDELHEKMEAKGFKRTIVSDGGTRYQLPDAEYNYSGNVSRADVLERAYNVAKTIRSNPAVLVTESAGRRWRGLDAI